MTNVNARDIQRSVRRVAEERIVLSPDAVQAILSQWAAETYPPSSAVNVDTVTIEVDEDGGAAITRRWAIKAEAVE